MHTFDMRPQHALHVGLSRHTASSMHTCTQDGLVDTFLPRCILDLIYLEVRLSTSRLTGDLDPYL
jgi:hypothetical protein